MNDEICVHRRDSIIGRALKSPCRSCELERDPELAARAVRTYVRVEDVRAGRLDVDEAVRLIRKDYGA